MSALDYVVPPAPILWRAAMPTYVLLVVVGAMFWIFGAAHAASAVWWSLAAVLVVRDLASQFRANRIPTTGDRG